MVQFPNCKINLGLHITSKRADGFHNIETVFYPVGLKDILEMIVSNQFEFSSTGIAIPGDASNNLCIKAYQLLKKDFPELPLIKMHLHKDIPMGAGLGGGSADGAFALELLNEKFRLNLSTEQLINYAAILGSDCPFFILNKPAFASGRGELLEPIALDLSAYTFVLVHPGIHVNTKWAFEQIQPRVPAISIKEIIQFPIVEWKLYLQNDFEAPIIKQHPEIAEIKSALYADGAIYASMSGSGSSVFGIYPQHANIQIKKQLDYRLDII
ncbi:MAG: 4-(cytidine 5'-diphospho)-2-C-methyl-D-erythritol kinase [Sphingobacteriia bacterium]